MKKLGEIVTDVARRVIWRLADLIPPMSFVVARQERLYAEGESAVLLELYRGIRSANAQLAGKEIYERVVAHRLGCDETEAREIVRHADESYAQWPDERDLKFRDVVHYVIVHHLLASHTGRVGTLANTEQTVMANIPDEL